MSPCSHLYRWIIFCFISSFKLLSSFIIITPLHNKPTKPIKPNQTEQNRIELNRTALHWTEPQWPELNWAHPNSTELYYRTHLMLWRHLRLLHFPRPLRNFVAINGIFTISGLRPWITNMPAYPRITILRYQHGEDLAGWLGVGLLRILRFRENRSKLAFSWRNRGTNNDKWLGSGHWLFLLC
jgi:hypothetical protein